MTVRKSCAPLLAAALAVGCAPSVTKDEPVTESAATLALFAPDSANPCGSVLPFPSDLAKDPTTGRLNIPYCLDDSADQSAMKSGLRTLDGYALGSTLTTRFSRPIDATTAAAAVKVFDAATGASVAVGAAFDAAQENTLFIQPLASLAEGKKYLVAITTDLKDAEGNAIAPDQVFVFAKSPEPLVDEFGYSRFSVLSDADANALEALRQGYAPLFEGLAALGVARESVAVAWAFTTQTVHASLPALAAVAAQGGAQFTWENKIKASAHPLLAAAGIPATALCEIHSGRVTLRSLLTDAGTFGVDPATGAPLTRTEVADYLLITPTPDPAGNPGCATPPAWSADKIVVFAHGLGRCKNDALALANAFAAAGFAVLTVDGPFAGARALGNLGDQDLDGCADQPATPEFIALPGQSPNPFAVRDHLREWALELDQIVAAAHAQPWALAGAETGTATAKVAVAGHSWGGMAVSLASALLADDASALAVNASGAELGSLFEPAVRASVAAGLEAAGVNPTTEPGLTLLAQQTAESVAAFRWAMEPGDPLYGATAGLPTLVQVAQGADGQAEASLHGAAASKKLATAFGIDAETLAKTTFALSTGGAPLCDDGTAIVGTLLQPCVEDRASALYPLAMAMTGGMQRQMATFLASSVAGAPLVCDPDITKSCP